MQDSRALIGLVALLVLACRSDPPKGDPIAVVPAPSPPRLVVPEAAPLDHFADEHELRAYLTRVEELEAIRMDHLRRRWRAEAAAATAAATAEDPWVGVEEWVTTGSSPDPEMALSSATSVVAYDAIAAYTPNLVVSDVDTITNNQERGVDEGDIVKRIGDFLIVLRRGRLHSIEIGSRPGDRFRLADVTDVFPYPIPHEAWYDEVLVDDRRIVVLGYSYETEATELSIFELDRDGRIRHRASHAIRSGDYFSGENYGSRLVGRRLVIYAPIDLSLAGQEDIPPWPVYSTWGRGGLSMRWASLVDEIEIVAPIQSGLPTTLHTVIECELDGGDLDCEARGIVGDGSSVHYVSQTAFHLWIEGPAASFDPMTLDPAEFGRRLQLEPDLVGGWVRSSESEEAFVYRIPFDGSAIGAVAVSGSPFGPFSFREFEGALDLFLVRWADWARRSGSASRWRIPLSSFGHPLGASTGIEVSRLPDLKGGWDCNGVQRFVGNHLLYGNCREASNDRWVQGVHVVELVSPPIPTFLETPGRVDRIEPIDGDALIVGGAEARNEEQIGTHLLPLLLAETVRPAPSLFLAGLVELENRSHAFNWTFREDGRLMGLPFARIDRRDSEALASATLLDESEPASLIAFFTMDGAGDIARAGDLAERRPPDPPPDDCDTSCYDWYGSVRPIFLEGRVLGLIGDELAEARLGSRGIRVVQRLRMRGGR